MHIAMIASECEPFAKTGGLADVVDALSRSLGGLGHEVDVYLPRYRGIEPPGPADTLTIEVPAGGGRRRRVRLLTAAADGYRLRLVDHRPSYDRPELYLGSGRDFADNAARFALLGRTALEAMRRARRAPDVVHGHDWQAGPALLLLRHRYGRDELLRATPSLLTCHNLAYHGWTARQAADAQLDLPSMVGTRDGVDLLAEGIGAATLVNTVSPTFARESLEPDLGMGLADSLRALGDRYFGILNGIDTELWDPATDTALPANYSVDDLAGKQACRAALCAELGLAGDGPLLGLVGRLDPQKGFDLLTNAAPGLLAAGARICVLGTGDASLVAELAALASEFPDRLAVVDRFDRDLARRIYAGTDLFLMPSRFEPSGQGQMIALRYGTLPVVRATGGLADTVRDADADPLGGNGFVFGPARAADFAAACRRAMATVADEPRWVALQRRGMSTDFSWRVPAEKYVAVYQRATDLAGAG